MTTARDVKTKLLSWLDSQGFDTLPDRPDQAAHLPARARLHLQSRLFLLLLRRRRGARLRGRGSDEHLPREEAVPARATATPDGRFRLLTPKHFYVSPFSDLDLAFDFKLRVPGEHARHSHRRPGGRRPPAPHRAHRKPPAAHRRRALAGLRGQVSAAHAARDLPHPLARLPSLAEAPARGTARPRTPQLQRGVHRPHQSIASKSRSQAQ